MSEEEMLEELLLVDRGLTPWELKFIDDIAHQLYDLKVERLSERQCLKLREIWKDHCDCG